MLERWLPAVHVPSVQLGAWPTPIATIELAGRPIWVKREGDSDARYGGNKLRTLEAWFGEARARGVRKIWATGAFGSNHAVATLVHAARAGLDAGAILFPQPTSPWARENALGMIATGCELRCIGTVATLPFAMLRVRAPDALVMPPGGATPIGTFGALAAALELADQVREGSLPAPARIVLAAGSTCTAAGLLAGLAVARAIGAWTRETIVHAVRVTPWPVTSRVRIARLAQQTLARLAALGGPTTGETLRSLHARLAIDPGELGPGYGEPTPTAAAALVELSTAAGAPRLDGVYSAKAAAALVRLHHAGDAPLLFWATKSTALAAPPADLSRAPRALRRWLVA
ncbi:MAG TPA: pyridoxal-phosphate dependent enzyme [Kofleriaceae bacterium]|jgi:D-cysteine desulfhydrase